MVASAHWFGRTFPTNYAGIACHTTGGNVDANKCS